MRSGQLEITDLLWPVGEDGRRRLVAQADAVDELLRRGQTHAARLVRRMPTTGRFIDSDHLDRLGIRVHCELQRLTEELQLGRRVAELLEAAVRDLDPTRGNPVSSLMWAAVWAT